MLNRLLNSLSFRLSEIEMMIHSVFVYFILKIKSIGIGKNNKFYGILKFYKEHYSKFEIGNDNVFRSSRFSNLIGINRPCIISTLTREAELKIGNNCGFSGTVINCFKGITISDNVMIGANCLIMDGDWHMEDSRSSYSNPVFIGRNVWIGEDVKVLKGVTIGENSVIGAGSIVTKDIPKNVYAAGNPCKFIKSLND